MQANFHSQCVSASGGGNAPRQFKKNDNFLCPSHTANAASPFGNTNYYGCQGGGPDPATPRLQACQGTAGRPFFHNGIFHSNSKYDIAHLRDGASNVVLIGETRYSPYMDARGQNNFGNAGVGWDSALRYYPKSIGGFGMPLGLCATNAGINSSSHDSTKTWPAHVALTTFGSQHPGGAGFAMADGSTCFLSESIDLALYRTLGQRASRMPKSSFFQ
jgi:hypothetical protein